MTPPAASAAAPAIHPRRTVGPRRPAAAPRRPRRVSGPARPARGRAGSAHPVGLAEAVASHRLLDRLISGRIWIGVIAFALIGIVTMQLGLLKLNAGIGRSLAREALLQRENATLSAGNSELAAGERIETQAQHMGMELIPSGALHFLAARPSIDASRGAAALSTSVSTVAAVATTTSTTATPSATTAPGESSSGTETAAATSSVASTETSATATSTPAAGGTSETRSATTQEPSPPGGAGSTSETHPSETASPNSGPSGGAGEAPGASVSASTGGGTTPGG